MMRLDYGTQLSPLPIKLSIGTLRKPKLVDIALLGFDQFSSFEAFSKMTPESYYTTFKEEVGGVQQWESMNDDERDQLTMYQLILKDDFLKKTYVSLFDFFFIEKVIFRDDLFILLNGNIRENDEISQENVRGVIHEKIFPDVLDVIQQICCIHEAEEDINTLKFKNKTARKIYEKMLKAQKEEKKKKKADINLSLPNIISAVSNRHQTINPINVWDLTLFQLLDTFSRMQASTVYDIDSTRVSVWGDEKKVFNIALWYKNEYDKK